MLFKNSSSTQFFTWATATTAFAKYVGEPLIISSSSFCFWDEDNVTVPLFCYRQL
jgi:hypothetical protein